MITTEIVNGICRARVAGEMTIYTALECRDLLQQALLSCDEIEIDLSSVSEVDSAGVQLLIQVKRQGAKFGKPVRLAAHSQEIAEMIDLYRLAPEFGDLMIMSSR